MAERSPAYKILSLCLLLLPLFCLAQTFTFKQYTTHDGLPIDNVYAAAQDADGFMWFGTDFGISRFDGAKFVNYDKKNSTTNRVVTDIVYAGGDSLLFIFYPFTIQVIHTNGRIKTVAFNPGFSLQQIARHHQEYYFYQREFGKYILLENGRSQILKADSVLGVKETLINAIIDLDENGLAFCTSTGLYIKNGSGLSRLMPGQNVQNLVYTKPKRMIAVVDGKLLESDVGSDFKTLPFAFPKGFKVYHAGSEADGAVWFRGLDKGVFRLLNNQLQEMSERLRMENKGINEFFQDGDGNFWICTDGSGILLKKRASFIHYETSDGLVNNKILRLLKQNNSLFIGTSNGISVLENDHISPLDLPSSRQGLKYVFQLFPVNNSTIGVSIGNTFFSDKSGFGESPTRDIRLNGHSLRAYKSAFAWQEDEDNYWMFQPPNLMLQAKAKQPLAFSLSDYHVRKVYSIKSFQNKKWVGTDAGIVQIENNHTTLIDSFKNERLGQVFEFAKDKMNRLWIATEIGLFVYKDDKFISIKTGLTAGSNYCRGITIDDKGMVWVATWDGIFVTDGKTTKNFNTNDGLPSKTTNCILFDSTGKDLYIGTENGLAVLKRDALNDTIGRKNIFIHCNLAGNDSAVVNVNSSLPPTQNRLGFYLSFPWYQGIGNISYDYRMDNGAWVATDIPSIEISRIGSGKHKFYARAKINGVPVTNADTAFTFTIEKPYYETWWFLLLFVLLFQLLIFLIINYFNRKAKARKLAVQSQQAEYASLKQQAFTLLMNPHFIFNALNSVQYYVNRQDRQSANKYLSNFATLIRRSFDASQRSFVGLDEELETIRLYLELEKMRFTDKFDYVINVSPKVAEEDWMLPSMMLQPFLENAVLHGLMPLNEKGLLTIEATTLGNSLQIMITDNGIGIEKSKAFRSGGKHKSKGMQLIKERLELLSKLSKEPLRLTISELNHGTPNPGTKIVLVIPQEAYDVFQQQRGQG